MTSVYCDCCRSEMVLIGAYQNFLHYACLVCGYEHFFRENIEINAHLYESDSDYNDDLAVGANHKDLIQWSHKKTINYLKNIYPNGNASILDVGCFNGFFIRELLDCGFNATGIDFNMKALEFGKLNYHLENHISAKTIQALHLEGGQFDVVTLFEVVEHLENFPSVLLEASKLIKPNGLLVISTPNSKMCWRPTLDFPPHHLSRFTPKALATSVHNLGFKKVLHLEQTSSFDLLRNYLGSFFRQKEKHSMRGGAFKNKKLTNRVRTYTNKVKWLSYVLLYPIDMILHLFGVRYISQVVIARK